MRRRNRRKSTELFGGEIQRQSRFIWYNIKQIVITRSAAQQTTKTKSAIFQFLYFRFYFYLVRCSVVCHTCFMEIEQSFLRNSSGNEHQQTV